MSSSTDFDRRTNFFTIMGDGVEDHVLLDGDSHITARAGELLDKMLLISTATALFYSSECGCSCY